MNKSVLILEENSIIHGLIASALDLDGLTLHHEFDPGEYVERARTLMPDLILISNADQQREYAVCRELRADASFATVPMVLLANSKDRIEPSDLQSLHVDGVIRKPFEASDVQQQVSKHLDMVDLIGSAYDYKKSQSLRDEGMDPLADMEVLDSEILGFLQEAGERTQAAAAAVPEVDFSEELQGEAAPAQAVPPDATPPDATPAEAAPQVDESTLEETLEPERAFEMVEEPAADEPTLEETLEPEPAFEMAEEPAAVEVPESLSDSAIPLEGEDFDESRAEAAAAPEAVELSEPSPEAPAMEKLGEADVLAEDSGEEAALTPEGFDQSFEPAPEAGLDAPLDDVEMELAGADIDFDAIGEELEEGGVELFETNFTEGQEPLREGAEDEMIPQAVRRMVEMKPVLSMTGAAAAGTAEAGPDVTFTPDDNELASMADELAEMDEIEVGEAFAAEAETAAAQADTASEQPAEDWKLTDEPAAEEAGEDFFHEDYLGDEEIDDEKIREALAESGGADQPFEVVVDDEEEAAFAADMMEDPEIQGLEALDEEELETGGEVAAEELLLDEDEESMVLSSIEKEEALEEALEETGVAAEPAGEGGLDFEEPLLETAEEDPAAPAAPEAEQPAESLIDKQLEALEGAATLEDGGIGAEPAESELAGFPSELTAEEGLELPEEPEAAAAIAAEPAAEPAAAPAEEETMAEEPWGAEGEEASETASEEAPFISEEARDAAVFTAAEEEGAISLGETPVPGGEDGAAATEELDLGGVDFDSALAELQLEIEANPEGERLDEILVQEGIQDAVEAIDFRIPQHENLFTRAIGILEIPGGDSVGEATLQRMTGNAVSAAVGPAPAGGDPAGSAPPPRGVEEHLDALHESVMNRLSQVLDDVIRDTVRRVVREEVPQLMDKIRREEDGHGG
ncbi:MAG: hypothetical protein IIA41_00090 [SAR324 cluster bacterium]|nr:hypothetical protein [SAR324 cluster bacterium]